MIPIYQIRERELNIVLGETLLIYNKTLEYLEQCFLISI